MKRLFALAVLAVLATAVGSQEPPPNLYVTVNGAETPNAFPVEAVAVNFFSALAEMEQNEAGSARKYLLGGITGLSQAGADALVAMAISEEAELPDPLARAQEVCADLQQANTRAEIKAVIESSEAEDVSAANLQGAKMLNVLSPLDRTKVINYFDQEIRPNMAKTSLDYDVLLGSVGDAQFKQMACDAAHPQ